MTRGSAGVLAVIVVATLVAGCLPDDQPTRSADPSAVAARLGPALMARLDSANQAFRAGSYERAGTIYRSIAADAPNESVGWFGVFMAERAQGHFEAADSALERAREASPGASLIRPEVGGERR